MKHALACPPIRRPVGSALAVVLLGLGLVVAAPAAAGAASSNAGMRPDPTHGRATVIAQPRESLDALIRRTQRGSPFRDDVMRRAFVLLNSAVLAGNAVRALPGGTELQVPTVTDVLSAAGITLPRPSEPDARAVRDPAEESRQWVRFP